VTEFSNGYGQCKADLLREIGVALDHINDCFDAVMQQGRGAPDAGTSKKLHARREALHWVRAMVKGLKSPR
tara:strand:+ start:11083 stop:11295 length:213 start_codon:yes stop_codon:yes gene_type:complete